MTRGLVPPLETDEPAPGLPLDHIYRPLPPWRSGSLTECGHPSETVKSVITRDAMIAKVKKQGQQRAALTSCMTCWTTARYNREWDRAPSEVLARDIQRRGYGADARAGDSVLDRELRAIAALIARHREDFEGFLSGLDETENLAARRRERRRRGGAGPVNPVRRL